MTPETPLTPQQKRVATINARGGFKAIGQKASSTNRARHGTDFYVKMGKKSHAAWDANGRKPRGFSKDHDLAVRAGALGGSISKRSK